MTDVQHVDKAASAGRPTRREPVFLLAPPRSYSTVTVALLAGHPDIYGFPEMRLFIADTVADLLDPDPRGQYPPAFTELKGSGIFRAVADLREGNQEDAAIRRAKAWLAERFGWTPQQLMDHLLGLAYPRIGLEKSPETVSSADALDACVAGYPDARYIHLTRHPVSTMRSMCENWQHVPGVGGEALVVRAASAWYLGHVRILRKLAQLPVQRWIRIRAEDLLREPLARLPSLIDWLGLPTGQDIVTRMTHTENWRFASTGPSGRLLGGDPKFMRAPALRPIPEPGDIAFDQSWGLPDEMRDRMTILARFLGY